MMLLEIRNNLSNLGGIKIKPIWFIIMIAIIWCGTVNSAMANQLAPIHESAKTKVSPPVLDAKSWLLLDFNSGRVLASFNPDLRIEPASLSKLMTAYIVFAELAKGSLKLEDNVHISNKAWKTQGSRMFARVNSEVSVDDLLKGLIVQSGNDAAVALAEHIAGSEEGFVEIMNQTAAELGLNQSQYRNSTGLPDTEHYSTARDISLLTNRLIKEFPQEYGLYSIREFKYNKIEQQNRNVLLWRDDSVDGVKTGHTNSAGYCLVGSASRDGHRLIATVIGAESKRYRADAVHSLLKYGYAAYEMRSLFDPNEAAANLEIFMGEQDTVPVGAGKQVAVTFARGSGAKISASISNILTQTAPISKSQAIATLKIGLNGSTIQEYPLFALETINEGSLWKQAVDSVRLWWQ